MHFSKHIPVIKQHMIVLGTNRYRWKDTKINLREIGCQVVNMTGLNDGCVHWHHFTSTAVNLMSRYLSLLQTLSHSCLHMSFTLTKF